MATPFGEITTVVRRKGCLSVVIESYGDIDEQVRFYGDRRSRQIAKRHWIRQSDNGSDSSGRHWNIRKKSPIGG